jgi:hypothetical protein
MKLAWATDIHLNFVTVPARRRFLESIAEQADALVVNFNAGDHSISVSMRYADYVQVERPELGMVAAELEP